MIEDETILEGWSPSETEDETIPEGWSIDEWRIYLTEKPGDGSCQETKGEPVLVAYDFIQMYPNLEVDAAAKDAHDAMLETPITFSSINYREAVKYISANMTEKGVEQCDLAYYQGEPKGKENDQPVGALSH